MPDRSSHFAGHESVAVEGDLGSEIFRQRLGIGTAWSGRVIDGANIGEACFEFGALIGRELVEACAVVQSERGGGGKGRRINERRCCHGPSSSRTCQAGPKAGHTIPEATSADRCGVVLKTEDAILLSVLRLVFAASEKLR